MKEGFLRVVLQMLERIADLCACYCRFCDGLETQLE